MVTVTHATEGLRMFRRHLQVKKRGFRQYPGDADRICTQIVDACWNGRFLQTSTGNYPEFYSRDIGWCTDPLIALGHKERLKKTIHYALEKFKRHGEITVAITPSGKPFNFPNMYSIDSVSYFFRTVRKVEPALFKKEEDFFNRQLDILYKRAIEPDTGLVRKDRHFSDMKDHALRRSSCYANTMVALLADVLKGTGLENPFRGHDLKKTLKENFWTGEYFLDDLSGSTQITGDSNVYPFLFKIIKDRKMARSAISSIQKEGLDAPFPLKYSSSPEKGRMVPAEAFVKDWEKDTIWSQLGMAYIELLTRHDKEKARKHLNEYTQTIEQNSNFTELYTKEGKPYQTAWFSADDSMLWASMYLHLKNRPWQR